MHPDLKPLRPQELWQLTAVPFAASDDIMSAYQLSTFLEDQGTQVGGGWLRPA